MAVPALERHIQAWEMLQVTRGHPVTLPKRIWQFKVFVASQRRRGRMKKRTAEFGNSKSGPPLGA